MKNLKIARIKKGFTQEELGKMVNVQKSAVSKYERGEIQPSQEVLMAFSRILEVTTDYLLGISDDPHPMPNTNITPERAKELLRKPQNPDIVLISVQGSNGESETIEMPKKEFDDLLELKKVLHRQMLKHLED